MRGHLNALIKLTDALLPKKRQDTSTLGHRIVHILFFEYCSECIVMAQHRAKAVSLRYLAAKAAASLEEVYTHMQSSAQISLTDAIAKGMERFQKQLTCAGVVTGAAMSPTLNSSWSQTDPGRVEHFLIRMIPRPVAHKTIFDGDVVAFESPLSTSVMVRRIAALEGDVMVTSDDPTPDDEEFTIPQVRYRQSVSTSMMLHHIYMCTGSCMGAC